jgi:hypothetical protein
MDKYLKYKKKYVRLIGGAVASTTSIVRQQLNLTKTPAGQYVFEYIDDDKTKVYIFDPFRGIEEKHRERTMKGINGNMCNIVKFVPRTLDDEDENDKDKCDIYKCDTLVVTDETKTITPRLHSVLMADDCESIVDFIEKYERMKLMKRKKGHYFFVDNLTKKIYYTNDITDENISNYNDKYYRIVTVTKIVEFDENDKEKLEFAYARIYSVDGTPYIIEHLTPTRSTSVQELLES